MNDSIFPVESTIEKRSSVRTYDDKRPLTTQEKEDLKSYAESLRNPFHIPVRFHFIERETASKGEKLGTYGTIKGASFFVGVSADNVEFALEATGYTFEQFVLYATSRGLGTVWLAATFNRTAFSSAMDIQDNELFPVISPIGYPSDKKSIIESITRKSLKSSQRLPWEKLFFNANFSTPLTKQDAGSYATPLEMLRLAPSARNGQPWRVVKDGLWYHFYETHAEKADEKEQNIKKVDMGIALNHFSLTAGSCGLHGEFEKCTQIDFTVPANTTYITSWKIESV